MDLETLEVLPGRVWVPDRVKVWGECLAWTQAGTWKRLPKRSRPLTAFLRLRNTTAEQVAQFVAAYGPLGLCLEHGWYWRHRPGCKPRFGHKRVVVESANHYKKLAALFYGLIKTAHALRHLKSPELEAWQAITSPTATLPGSFSLARKAVSARVGVMLNNLLDMARVKLRLSPIEGYKDPWRVELFTDSWPPTFAALVLELFAACTGYDFLTVCHACGNFFAASRSTQKYCPDCGTPAARRLASRRWRARKKTQREEN